MLAQLSPCLSSNRRVKRRGVHGARGMQQCERSRVGVLRDVFMFVHSIVRVHASNIYIDMPHAGLLCCRSSSNCVDVVALVLSVYMSCCACCCALISCVTVCRMLDSLSRNSGAAAVQRPTLRSSVPTSVITRGMSSS